VDNKLKRNKKMLEVPKMKVEDQSLLKVEQNFTMDLEL
jgi:hypothetical protein